MTIYAHGRGLTTCGFCGRVVRYRIEGSAITILGREDWSSTQTLSPLPLFCSDSCERSSKSRLDDFVNQAAQ